MGNICIRDISNTLIHWKCNNNFRKQLKKLLQIKRDQIYISYLFINYHNRIDYQFNLCT